jgi:hypothetical protein
MTVFECAVTQDGCWASVGGGAVLYFVFKPVLNEVYSSDAYCWMYYIETDVTDAVALSLCVLRPNGFVLDSKCGERGCPARCHVCFYQVPYYTLFVCWSTRQQHL